MNPKEIMEPANDNTTCERFCSNCNQTKKTVGGYWKVAASGKTRRWLCSYCSAKRLDNKK